MFLIGIVCVLASFCGYVLSGGGEEFLRRALNKVPSGTVTYKSLELNWRRNRIEVSDVSHSDFSWPADKPVARFSNLVVPRLSVQLEGWPARVESIVVEGVRGLSIDLTEGFLQSGKLPEQKASGDLPRLEFKDCDIVVKLGGSSPLALNGCDGELERSPSGQLRGGFKMRELNGNPFELNVETLGDGRWVVTGQTIHLDTRAALSAKRNPFSAKLDPVGLLVNALFSGEMGAEGMLTSLHVAVQPETEAHPFACEGEVGYSNLSLKLPSGEDKSSEAIPFLLGMLLGADDMSGAKSWLKVDKIVAGEGGKHGRIAFHMAEGRLDFSSDEGTGSAFTGYSGGKKQPPLESLKGSVETDASHQPKRIVLRGFLGNQFSFEGRVTRNDDRSRTYELALEPRPGDAEQLEFGKPLWRLETRLVDYLSVKDAAKEAPLLDFEVEANTRGFPLAEWLPPGLKQLSGRLHAKGGFFSLAGGDGRMLRLDDVKFDDGGKIVYGGAERTKLGVDFHPFWEAFYALFATTKPWTASDLVLSGNAEVWLDKNLQWNRVRLSEWRIQSGSLVHDGTLTELALPDLKLGGEFTRDPVKEIKDGAFQAEGTDWSATLSGKWIHDGSKSPSGEFTYKENNVPLRIHPLREILKSLGTSKNERVTRSFSVRVTADGVKVEGK